MTAFPDAVPGLNYLTEGGQETELMYKHGFELPEFAMFPLLDDPKAVAALQDMYRRYLDVAARHGFGAIVGGLDYRASPDWAGLLGYSPAALEEFQHRCIAFLREVSAPYAGQLPDLRVVGIIGPRGDAYQANRTITAAEAEDYHSVQLTTLAAAGVRELGPHPETGLAVTARIGRFGPYVVHHKGKGEKDYRSLKAEDDVLMVGLSRAIELLAQPKRGRGGRTALKDLGTPQGSDEVIQLFDGPYGLYVKQGKVNASLPEGTTADTITLEQAVELLEAKAASGKGKGRKTSTAAAKPKAAAKGTAKLIDESTLRVGGVVIDADALDVIEGDFLGEFLGEQRTELAAHCIAAQNAE